jgi:hypothetical protein
MTPNRRHIELDQTTPAQDPTAVPTAYKNSLYIKDPALLQQNLATFLSKYTRVPKSIQPHLIQDILKLIAETESLVSHQAIRPQPAELLGLGFRDESDQRVCLAALHQHNPEGYRALPGQFSVIFEKKDLEWLEHYLREKDISFTIEPVGSIEELTAEEAAEWREDRFKNVMKSDFMNEEWLKAEIKRSAESLEKMGYVGSPQGESLTRLVYDRSRKSRSSR